MNELLRRMLLEARLREDDVAARVGVDPKTVRRRLDGRVPHQHNRAGVADLLAVEEADLWPGTSGTLTARARPDELVTVYPHREAIPREVWIRFFSSAKREIGILAHSAMFLAEDRGILGLLTSQGRAGVTVRIALEDRESRHAAEYGEAEDIDDGAPAASRNALALYRPLNEVENIEIRLHKAVLYNSIYHADDQLLVNQHAYGMPAEHAPVFCLRDGGGELAALYLNSLDRVWVGAVPLAQHDPPGPNQLHHCRQPRRAWPLAARRRRPKTTSSGYGL